MLLLITLSRLYPVATMDADMISCPQVYLFFLQVQTYEGKTSTDTYPTCTSRQTHNLPLGHMSALVPKKKAYVRGKAEVNSICGRWAKGQ